MTDTPRAAPDNTPRLLTFAEACARLAVSERQLRAGMNAANPIAPEAVKKRRKAD